MANKKCLDAIKAAAAGKLSGEEVEAAAARVDAIAEQLRQKGVTGTVELRRRVVDEVEQKRIEAAKKRQHAALNIIKRDALNLQRDNLLAQGVKPARVFKTINEGSSGKDLGVAGGRDSVAAQTEGNKNKYVGGMRAELDAAGPHLAEILNDPKMNADIAREMNENKPNGKSGITGNKDAQTVAKIFSSYLELIRKDLNRLGASIGKIHGYMGPQIHDDHKLLAKGVETWMERLIGKDSSPSGLLDTDVTFPDMSRAEVKKVLADIYNTIVTGVSANKVTAGERGLRVGPANMASSLGKHRVLHFKDAEAALAYNDEFGHGNIITGMLSYMEKASRVAALMDRYGPNPEVMFTSLVKEMRRKISDDATMSHAAKVKAMKGLDAEVGGLRQSFDIAAGLVSRPADVSLAKIGNGIRAGINWSKLGFVLASSISDINTAAMASQFRGSGWFKGAVAQMEALFMGKPKGEQLIISDLVGEGLDGWMSRITSGALANDGVVGTIARVQDTFFRMSGLTYFTDRMRDGAGQMIAREMGIRSKVAFDALPPKYSHVLGLHGIDATRWEAIRQAQTKMANGKEYITGDAMRYLPDSAVEPIVRDRLAFAKTEERRQRIYDDARRDLEMSVRRFFADETTSAVIEADARSRRTTTWGQRPGTAAGESMRFLMQFKGYPAAFTNRVLGRALYGHRQGAGLAEKLPHFGTLIGGALVFGYISIAMKDALRGYWPPRDPTDPRVWAAAFLQGGGAGLYGDFLFGQANRFGSTGVLGSIVGPTVGTAADIFSIGQKTFFATYGQVMEEPAKFPAGDALNLALNNTPFINLFYARPVLDWLILNAMKDAVSPGYLKRQNKRRAKDMGQVPWHAQEAF